MGGCRYLVVVLTLLAVVLLASCNIEAQEAAVYLHGLTDPLTSGVVVTVSSAGGSASSPTNSSGAWGVTVKTAAGRLYTLMASAPDGYRVTRIMHPALGSVAGNVFQFKLDGVDLAPDVVVTLARIETPTPTAQVTATLSRTPTAASTPTPTSAPSVFPTMPMPPVTPPLPTPAPLPTPPLGGWEPWTPPAELVNALAWELEWRLGVYADTDDPLWLAASSKGPVWPMMLPEAQHYDVEMPDGSNVETVLRWQAFVTPGGWRMVMSRIESPYQVAVIEGEGW